MTYYRFHQALGAFFLAPSTALRALLPPGLYPLEARPGHGVMALTAFDFSESEVGAYGELVLSVLVAPYAARNGELPTAATFPFVLASTTSESRAHAAERWYLPEHEVCLEMAFTADSSTRRVEVRDGGRRVLDLTVTRCPPSNGARLYQVYSRRDDRTHRVDLHIEGSLEQHDRELGRLELHDHPLAARIEALLADETPILEQSMGPGEQRFQTLIPH
jgi:hypothetical protein